MTSIIIGYLISLAVLKESGYSLTPKKHSSFTSWQLWQNGDKWLLLEPWGTDFIIKAEGRANEIGEVNFSTKFLRRRK